MIRREKILKSSLFKLQTLLKNAVLVGLMLSLASCTGRKLIIYPVLDTDIYIKDNGANCFSPEYFKDVLQAKIGAK